MKKIFCRIMIVFTLMLGFVQADVMVFAQGQTEFVGNVVTLKRNVDAYRQMDASSELVHSFLAGETVFLTGEIDGWCQIFYKGEPLYFQINGAAKEDVEETAVEEDKRAIEDELAGEEADFEEIINNSDIFEEISAEEAAKQSEELDKEFEEKKKSDETFVNTYVQQEKSKSNARMWIIIIAVLVVAIIAVSVVIAIRSKKEDKRNEADHSDPVL